MTELSDLPLPLWFAFLTMVIPLVQEKDRDKKEKEKEGKEKDKKVVNGHLFTAVGSGQATHCFQCNKAFNNKEAYHCSRKYLCLFLFCFHSADQVSCCFNQTN